MTLSSGSFRIRTLVAVGASLIMAIGCTKKSKVDYNLDLAETLRWNIQTEPPSLDWHIATDTTSSRITDAMMEGLVTYGYNGDETTIEPALASSWESSKDMKKWTFTLRSDVTWTDGVAFTAQHVIDGWERLLNPKTGAEYANFLFNVKNAKKYFEGKIKDFKEVGVAINEKGQIVVQLETPQSYFPAILGHHSTYPTRKDVIEKFGDKWTEPGNHVSLGAFKLKIWDHDKAIVLERNESYFGKKPAIKYILGRVITEQSTALNMFKKGEIDALDEIPSVEIEKVKQMPEYKKTPVLAVYFYGLNVKRPPLDNVKVRRALNLAIDREEINKALGGEKIPAYNIVPPGLSGHNAAIGLKFDPEAARKLLDEAGYKDRSKFPRIQLGFNTNENHQRIAENVQAQLKRNLGIELELTNEEWKTYLKNLHAKNYQMYRLGWVADFPDADTFINLFITNGGNNHTLWSNKKYDALIEQGVAEIDVEKRKQIYAEAQKIINEEDVPVIPLYYYRNQYLVNKRIKGYPMNVMNKFSPNEIVIERE
jgi:oligopeptide transport system substrate-binding protein